LDYDEEGLTALLRQRRRFPAFVGHIPASAAQVIGATHTAVLLSWDTMEKQRRNHRDLKHDEYHLIPWLLADSLILLDSKNSLVMAGQLPEKSDYFYRLAVKTTWLYHDWYVVSFHRMRPRDFKSIKKRGTIMREWSPK
jgi:hypothetical protein